MLDNICYLLFVVSNIILGLLYVLIGVTDFFDVNTLKGFWFYFGIPFYLVICGVFIVLAIKNKNKVGL